MQDIATTQCAWEGCANPSLASYDPKSASKYCRTCKPKAREAWMKARRDGEEIRQTRYAGFAKAWKDATKAAQVAWDASKPVPMVVQQHARVLDDSSEVIQEWVVEDGVCGFAWLVSRPGNASFSHWAKKNIEHASKAYRGGIHIPLPIGRSSQSLTRKEAAARAMQDSLRESLADLDPKVEVYAHSRID